MNNSNTNTNSKTNKNNWVSAVIRDDDEKIEELIKEYILMEKKYKLKSNCYIPIKRK